MCPAPSSHTPQEESGGQEWKKSDRRRKGEIKLFRTSFPVRHRNQASNCDQSTKEEVEVEGSRAEPPQLVAQREAEEAAAAAAASHLSNHCTSQRCRHTFPTNCCFHTNLQVSPTQEKIFWNIFKTTKQVQSQPRRRSDLGAAAHPIRRCLTSLHIRSVGCNSLAAETLLNAPERC